MTEAPPTLPAEHPTNFGARLLTLVLPSCYLALGLLLTGRWSAGLLFGFSLAFLHRYLVTTVWWSGHHRRGMRELRAGRPAWALEHFRDAEAFYEAHPNLDEYRALLLLSPLGFPHVLVARYHQALCLTWLGRGLDAAVLLEPLERRYPDFDAARELLVVAQQRGNTDGATAFDLGALVTDANGAPAAVSSDHT